MTDRNADMRHILAQVRTLTGGTVMESSDFVFEIPVANIEMFDDPYGSTGTTGASVSEIADDIRQNGLKKPIEVGWIENGDEATLYCFNGNHRLAAYIELGLETIRCVNSSDPQSTPLSRDDVRLMGGS